MIMELELISTIMQTQLASKLGKNANSSDISMSALNIGSTFGGGSSGSSEFSILMSALMYKLVEQNSGQISQSSLAALSMNTDFILSPVINSVSIGASGQNGVSLAFNQAMFPLDVGLKCSPSLKGSAASRSPELLRAIVDQFQVERNSRYTPHREGYTYCNIYVQDVMSALGAEFPHLGAVSTEKWLSEQGVANGWYETDARTAQMYANAGRPAITSMGSDGHLQVIVPEQDGAYDFSRGVAISQAGSKNYAYTHQVHFDKLRYWVHE
jgi:hypothetical protein